jgi:major membrane immunogen (membrane-anchored lipoprotein)
MKMMKYTLYILAIILFYGCTKSSSKIENGTYTGTFTVQYTDGNPFGEEDTLSRPVTIELKTNKKFECSGNSDKYPAGGSGKYKYTMDKINFEDENGWFADFDWNLILKGEYNYTKTGNNLKLYKQTTSGYYEYNLIKQ